MNEEDKPILPSDNSPQQPLEQISNERAIDKETNDNESVTIPQPPQPKTMEVHHHAHHSHEKKTWKNYFWEFFMLFLAVFCCFLAELQVEHYIEHQREHKYAQTLLEDLTNDTLDLSGDIKFWNRIIKKADTVRNEIEKPDAVRDHQLLYKCVTSLNDNNTFLYHDRTIQQLKSSGNFRLIRKNAIADSIMEYDAWIQKTINDIENTYSRVMLPELQTLENQLFNSKFFYIARNQTKLDSALQKEPTIIMVRKGKEDLLFQFYNKVSAYASLARARVYFLKMQFKMANNLMGLLHQEYHLL